MDFLSLLPEEMDVSPAYRQKQIFSWLHKHGVQSFDAMTNLPKTLRADLTERHPLTRPKEAARYVSADGTRKILWEFSDGQRVESAVMSYKHGVSVCLSTQAGCRQGCRFCASGAHGFTRNLTAGEMASQAYGAGVEFSSIVLMGTGEPLDNFDQTVRFIKLISHPGGRGLSPRHISVSTCGNVPGILKLAEQGLPVTLSVSLHAPDNETRNVIMPVNEKYPIEDLLDACSKYFEKTGRRISYEYVIIEGLNDSPGQAKMLKALLRGKDTHINIIPYNAVAGKPYAAPKPDVIRRFAQELGETATVRRTLGADIGAACGQLRSNHPC
jgi:23S rRNA (adenine2503-C2)-methyltransferase